MDVIPFVPTMDMTVEECVALSRRVAGRIWEELAIPVYLYEDAATSPERVNLASVRKGQFEGMAEKMKLPEWAPDYGERRPHPTAGVVAVGARMPLIAYNVNLDTSDLEIANKIARSIRAAGGGFKYCKAIGVMLGDRNIAQVSMNLVNYEGTPIYYVFEMIRAPGGPLGGADHRQRAGGPDPGQGPAGLRGVLPEAGEFRLPQAGDGVPPDRTGGVRRDGTG